MRTIDFWACVRFSVTAIDMSSPEHGDPTLSSERHYDNPALLTMPPDPEGLPAAKLPVLRYEVQLSFPSLHESR